MSHTGAARAAIKTYSGLKRLPDESWIPAKRTYATVAADQMMANIKAGKPVHVPRPHWVKVVSLDTPRTPVSEITTDPYAAAAKALRIEDDKRRGKPGYFEWRAEQGLEWWLEQEAKYPPADNDNYTYEDRAAA